MIDADGKNRRLLTPDGKSLCFCMDNDLYVMDIAGGEIEHAIV